jgi:hypothetical protein
MGEASLALFGVESMVDKKSLRRIGFGLGAVAMAVTFVATVLVADTVQTASIVISATQ